MQPNKGVILVGYSVVELIMWLCMRTCIHTQSRSIINCLVVEKLGVNVSLSLYNIDKLDVYSGLGGGSVLMSPGNACALESLGTHTLKSFLAEMCYIPCQDSANWMVKLPSVYVCKLLFGIYIATVKERRYNTAKASHEKVASLPPIHFHSHSLSTCNNERWEWI